ncbi:hypothetical protein J7U46_09495 [Pelomonas sp. V22]|uniref:hypothetical protein n=1 Tax=Pelomonas sp. V22 TaxID=2822139 RepID=UPI0024A9FD61|nr:hypothetical protein [Pelomonas sp. V22]MDI4633279.1 hypothetical protein [Pelomonas sp. V22]
MNPYAWIAALALAAFCYLLGRHDGRQLADGEKAIAERVADKAAQAGRESVAKAISEITVRHTTVQNAIEREVRNVPVYTDPDCRVGPDGLRLLNAAIAGTGQVSGSPELPASGASR